ncbi:MAG: hypothetical protein KatS3mg082_2451 [Nitrospiraceae bacterium]|nr:MAG: hypothetical protein KatS3mg082_2451 [Nitrospiraceae bacterium]
MNDFAELKREGLSIQAISSVTGFDRKTVRKCLLKPDEIPACGPRRPAASKLDEFKPYLEERLKAGGGNAAVLLRELRERNYTGGCTILKDWLRPQREEAGAVAERRFETPRGRQAQVDRGHWGSLEMDGPESQLWGFVLTLGKRQPKAVLTLRRDGAARPHCFLSTLTADECLRVCRWPLRSA